METLHPIELIYRFPIDIGQSQSTIKIAGLGSLSEIVPNGTSGDSEYITVF